MSVSYFQVGCVAAIITLLASVIRTLYTHKKYPAAPGTNFGAFSKWCYVWQVWKGDFQVWNTKQHAEHGKIIRVAPHMYSIDDPEAVKVIYGVSSPMIKSEWYAAFGEPGTPKYNLFSAREPKFHAQMRRLVANVYSLTSIKSCELFVDRCNSSLLNQLDHVVDAGQVLDLQRWMQCYAFDVVAELTFGQRAGFIESNGKDVDGIMESIEKLTEFGLFYGIESRLLPILLMKLGQARTGCDRWMDRLMALRQAEPVHDEEKKSSTETTAEDFVTKLKKLRDKNPADYETYRGDGATLVNLLAGSDTTSVSLTGILYYLAADQRCFEKLRREILDAEKQGEADTPITFDQTQKLPYLQAVIKEGMRLHPATGLPMWRVVPKGGVTVADTFFPENSQLGINVWVAHRNPDVFGPDFATFRPERWLTDPTDPSSTDRIARMERYYMPFGVGTRTCIGKNISILGMAKVVPELVRRYDFELLPDPQGSTRMKCLNRWFVKQQDLNVQLKRRVVVAV